MTKFFKFKAEVVPGKCPTCEEHTLLVGLTKEYFRCMTCGADLEQHINGKISYIPTMHPNTLKSDLKNYPNHLLTCGKCQWVGKQIGTTIVEALI